MVRQRALAGQVVDSGIDMSMKDMSHDLELPLPCSEAIWVCIKIGGPPSQNIDQSPVLQRHRLFKTLPRRRPSHSSGTSCSPSSALITKADTQADNRVNTMPPAAILRRTDCRNRFKARGVQPLVSTTKQHERQLTTTTFKRIYMV